ncbi:DsbA family protein [Neobacillus cucumis]|uniref:DsbA family protein n=1 Tax=Neobacillus cucumis TaxID=1740721 RepID=UPI0019634225|nr:thioredoxin domain-containing protein [Neobacillus cucumis]MBM7654926.1 protein-disulfide isomerase [Neobacillus cucumis]
MANQKRSYDNSSTKFIFLTVCFVAAIIIGFIFLAPHKNQNWETAKDKIDNTNQHNIEKSSARIDYSNEPYIGKSSAPVSIIEFGDYKCPYCKMFNQKVVPTIKQEVDKGDAKLYFINDSFIYIDSIRAAKFAESVYAVLGNKAFWKFHELLYQKQPQGSEYEKMDIYNEKFLTDTLKEVVSDVDVIKVVKYFDANKADAAWQRDMDLVNQLNVTGTPTIFVNGKVAKTLDDLKNMIDKAAKK